MSKATCGGCGCEITLVTALLNQGVCRSCKGAAVVCVSCGKRALKVVQGPSGPICMSCQPKVPAGKNASGKDNLLPFEKKFGVWLTSSLDGDLPATIRAFAFNLFEPAGEDCVTFGIELVGTKVTPSESEDWGCEEVWEPTQRSLSIPTSFSGPEWENCLRRMKVLLLEFLDSANDAASKLKSKLAIGIGFVDGDIEVVWTNK